MSLRHVPGVDYDLLTHLPMPCVVINVSSQLILLALTEITTVCSLISVTPYTSEPNPRICLSEVMPCVCRFAQLVLAFQLL